jgi:Family of unknown function (DUF6508)
MNDETVPAHGESLRGLAAFLPRFEAPGFEFGHWVSPRPPGGGSIVLGYYAVGATGSEFVEAAYALGLVQTGFDWGAWTASSEARALLGDPSAVSNATPQQLVKLLTALLRQDRFVEGALGHAYESGLLTAILRRASALGDGDGGRPHRRHKRQTRI